MSKLIRKFGKVFQIDLGHDFQLNINKNNAVNELYTNADSSFITQG